MQALIGSMDETIFFVKLLCAKTMLELRSNEININSKNTQLHPTNPMSQTRNIEFA